MYPGAVWAESTAVHVAHCSVFDSFVQHRPYSELCVPMFRFVETSQTCQTPPAGHAGGNTASPSMGTAGTVVFSSSGEEASSWPPHPASTPPRATVSTNAASFIPTP